MKKLCVFVVAIWVGVFLVGCSQVTAAVIQTADGRVFQVIQAEFDESSTELNTALLQAMHYAGLNMPGGNKHIYNEYGNRVNFRYGKDVEHGWIVNTNIFQIIIEFDNWESYVYFNEMDLQVIPRTQVDINRGLFTIERTITMQNPFRTFFDNTYQVGTQNRTYMLVQELNKLNGDVGDIELVYILHSSFRRGSTNATSSRRNIAEGTWEYHFAITDTSDIPPIIIVDRFANTPIWYAIGVGATIIFMLGIYIISKSKSKIKSVDQVPFLLEQ